MTKLLALLLSMPMGKVLYQLNISTTALLGWFTKVFDQIRNLRTPFPFYCSRDAYISHSVTNPLAKTGSRCKELLQRYWLLFTAVWKRSTSILLLLETDQLKDLRSLGVVINGTKITEILMVSTVVFVALKQLVTVPTHYGMSYISCK